MLNKEKIKWMNNNIGSQLQKTMSTDLIDSAATP